jgi:hypothetical protein
MGRNTRLKGLIPSLGIHLFNNSKLTGGEGETDHGMACGTHLIVELHSLLH